MKRLFRYGECDSRNVPACLLFAGSIVNHGRIKIVAIYTRLRDLKFRTKVVVSFFLVMFLLAAILGMVYARSAITAMVGLTRSNVQEIVRKNNAIVDTKLGRIGESTMSMLSDPDLFAIFNGIRTPADVNVLGMDRHITPIIRKYFAQWPEVYSVQLATSYFTFGNNTSFISGENYTDSSLYRQASDAKGSLIWVPTYDYTVMFGNEAMSILELDDRYIFSAARQVNSVTVDNFLVGLLDDAVERPTLIVNFKEEVYSEVFRDSFPYHDAWFAIASTDGHIVSSSHRDQLGRQPRWEWLQALPRGASGSRILTLEGQKVIACYDTSAVTGWLSVAVIPYEELVRTVLPAMRSATFLVLVLFLLLAIPLSIGLSGMLSGPLNQLLDAMRRMEKGDFGTPVPVESRDEIGYLTNRFNHLNERVKTLIEENYIGKLREKETEIMALNLQLNPHFLYNTLNIINWMAIEQGNRDISDMVMRLCDMMAYTLRDKRDVARLSEDLEWLSNYWIIMQARFEDKFTIEQHISPAILDCEVPKLFLQPFVENSILHGFEHMEQGGVIRIEGKNDEHTLCFTVADNGAGMTAEAVERVMTMEASHIGVRNVDKRIRLLYGSEFGVSVASKPGEGTLVCIRLPKRVAQEPASASTQ